MLEIIAIIIIFFILFGIGFVLIYKQVALVKKGEIKFKDRLQCLIYGILFSTGIMVVVSMGFIFTDNSLNPLVLIIPVFVCIVYISVYPLIDFLFIALSKDSDEGLTPFHSLISQRFINISKRRYRSIIMALFLYLILIIPPVLLSFLGLPFSMLWISWMLFYPLLILTYYGTKGYIAGISNQYYHIPEMKRYLFLNFENQKRGMQQFFSEPTPFIVFGMMLFVFVWAWISLIQTIFFFFTGSLAISTMSSYFVYVTLFFGITGYFTRFWGRKIKYRAIDIYFAAYLMAAIGINVLVNFLLVNIGVLSPAFSIWDFTREIIPNSVSFSWAAIIEESILISLTTYFFLSNKNEFKHNIKYSKITECGQKFDPIPLFTLLKNQDPILSHHAEETLRLMFERIPLKSKSLLNNWKFKDILIDGICDYNLNSQRVSFNILLQLERDAPEIVIPWIIEHLNAPNYDKKLPFSKLLLSAESNLIGDLPMKILHNFFCDSEWRVKMMGLKIINKLMKLKPTLKSEFKSDLFKLINDESLIIQEQSLKLISEIGLEIPQKTLFSKFQSSSQRIQAASINYISKIKIEKIDETLIKDLIPYLKISEPSLKSSVLDIISKIGKFGKFQLTLIDLFNALEDNNEKVRNSAIKALLKYYNENPKEVDVDFIIKKIDTTNLNLVISVITLLKNLWEQDPAKILSLLFTLIKFDDKNLKSKISEILIEKSNRNPNMILEKLLKVKDDSGFVSKGTITTTIIEIANKKPDIVIPFLIKKLKSTDPVIIENNLNALEILIDNHDFYIELNSILEMLNSNLEQKIKIKAAQFVVKLVNKYPKRVGSLVNELLKTLRELDSSSKITLAKSILEIAKKFPDLIPINLIINNFDDEDAFVREAYTKILGYIGYKDPSIVIDGLISKSLKDEDWAVRDAAIKSLGNILIDSDENQKIIKNVIKFIDDESKWVRRSVMNLLADIEGIDVELIPFEKVLQNLKDEDTKSREGVANLLKIYGFKDIENMFDYIIVLLGDNSKDVRRNMINSMVEIIKKTGLSKIISLLLKNLSDQGSLLTQQSIALILERTARYEDQDLKKRIISLLKVRCEVSQDPIICKAYNKLKEL